MDNRVFFVYIKEPGDKTSRQCKLLDVQCKDDGYRIKIKDEIQEKPRTFDITDKLEKRIVFSNADANNGDLDRLYDIFKKFIGVDDQLLFKSKGNRLLKFLKEQYNFEGFFHETHINNLVGILKSGYLKSRKELEDNNEIFVDSADKEVLKTSGSKTAKDKTRFYFQYGTPTNYRFNEKYPGKLVYLVFNWDILYEYCDSVTISNGNSANVASKSTSLNYFLDKYDIFMDWKSIFHRGVISDDINKEELKRKRNAEIDFNCFISTSFINKIIFNSFESKQQFIKILDDNNILKNYERKMCVDPRYFQQ